MKLQADPNKRRLTRDEAVELLLRPLAGVFSSLSEGGWIHSVPVHSAGDYLAAALLVTAPFALGYAHAGLAIFYIAAGVAVLAVSLVTNYQYSPKRAGAPAREAQPA